MSNLKAPFPYFGGKSGAAHEVWQALGEVKNYVEPFVGSAAMLLNAPDGKRVETINDFDGFVANYWRAMAHDPAAVARAADWPCNETDLFARHSWLVRTQIGTLADKLNADPDFYDAKVAGWWCWGLCNWIGSGWCSGTGPWVFDGVCVVDNRTTKPADREPGVSKRLPHLDFGRGINRQLPHLSNAGLGINRATGTLTRSEFIHTWFADLGERLRDVRVACGWRAGIGVV